jgi:NADH:ubiquinone oxidoreductase subunit D
VLRLVTSVGLLYRASESLLHARQLLAGMGYLDRLDYVACLNAEALWALSVEDSLHIAPVHGQSRMRTIVTEL